MKILIGMPAPDSWGGPISSEPPFTAALGKLVCRGRRRSLCIRRQGKTDSFFWKTSARCQNRLSVSRNFEKTEIWRCSSQHGFWPENYSAWFVFAVCDEPAKAQKFFFPNFTAPEAQDFRKTNFVVRFLIKYISRKVDGFGIHTSDELENFAALGFDKSKFYFVKNAITIHDNLAKDFTRKHKRKYPKFLNCYSLHDLFRKNVWLKPSRLVK